MDDPMLSEIGDGRLVKMEADYSSTVDSVLPEAEKLTKDGRLTEALEKLYVLEKQTRLAADMRSNTRVQIGIVKSCFESKKMDVLNENIVTLSKKRSLIKQAISKMVQECCTYVDQLPSKDERLKLIDTLRTVTAGKIYVEVERARLTYKLAQMKEADGKLDEASTIMQDLQIETFGSMDRQEKVELLLEQMRLCLAQKDYVRTQIISRKIATKFFDDEAIKVQQLKLKFYQLMIELDQHDSNYLAIARHYMAVYKTPIIQQDSTKLEEALKNVVLYVLLAPHDNEQSDMKHRLKQDKNLEKIPVYKELLQLFITQELISWKNTISKRFETVLRNGTAGSPPTGAFDPKSETGKQQWEHFQIRVGEHNIRMMAKYYKRMTLQRMADLLEWTLDKTEEFLCQLVVKGVIVAKIDRPAGVIDFQTKKSPVEVLDSWQANLSHLMEKLNKASHLILKEEMIHRHLHQAIITGTGVTEKNVEKTAAKIEQVA